ncbi:glutamate decarboxylase [Actinoplanes ianthinogenes]|uniref:Glutamate decarboxylase n=1 Tax=Actinoplanes ianthinogenes TaxID=122358 RepID=A0ABM7LLD5_9ACTN|nr:glutamate decarboxylase [Actinoplanes ianthinogenes]BCJ40058.1 glutamate decarboxylase [Actinoplanes ianthinogenes]GGR09991.1 glutamate decarboxylase [Actinoplanes ianthinogenes]
MLKHPSNHRAGRDALALDPRFGIEGLVIPRHTLPEDEVPPEAAYQIIHDELMLDGNARLNVATFVTTWMDPQADRLMAECADKNMIDKDEYPQTAELEMRCVSILSKLWNAPDATQATGCSTTGSSEAAMLAGLALKRRWQKRRRAAGAPADRPNLVMGINVQVCWEKFAAYWDVEMRLVPMEGDRLHLSAEEAVRHCDENTIGVVAVLGSTFDGSYEPVEEICRALDEYQQRTGIDVPVHVDGASGAFVAPFVDPDLVWDFRLPRVASINASGHKYGLVYPGVGWVVWRDPEALPEELIFWVNYLGDDMPTFALNFSRPGAQVVAQYYNFLRLGHAGYRRVQAYSREVATRLADRIAELGPFQLLTRGDELPVLAFQVDPRIDNFTVFDVSGALRERGWQVPAYRFPKNREDLSALRVVVRRGFTHDLADMLIDDLKRQLPRLEKQHAPQHDGATAGSFHH